MWLHSCVEFKKQNNEQRGKKKRSKPRNRLLTVENKLIVARGEVGGWMGEIDEGD